jgi:hypothetical protein
MFRFIGGIVGLFLLALVIVGAFKFQDTDFRDELVYKYDGAKIKALSDYKVVIYDLREELFPSRKRPTVVLKQEDELKMFIPLFKQFKETDWNEFWIYIYNGYYEGTRWIKYKHYHTPSEIQEWLKKRYEQPFGDFGQTQWNYFWQILSEDKQIKQVLSGGESTDIF